MNAKEHLKLAITYLPCFFLPMPYNFFEFVGGVLVGSLLPDIDHENSIAGSIIPAWLIFKHGKQTHTIIALLLISTFAYFSEIDFFYGLSIGYFTHLVADEITGNWLKYLLYPFYTRKYKKNKKG